MNYTEKGSKLYLFSIVLVAVIGGLLSATIRQLSPAQKRGFKLSSWEPILNTQMQYTALHHPAH